MVNRCRHDIEAATVLRTGLKEMGTNWPWDRRLTVLRAIKPGEGNRHLLQYSCLENSMEKGAWQAVVHSVSQSQAQLKQFSTHTHCQFSHDQKVLDWHIHLKKTWDAKLEFGIKLPKMTKLYFKYLVYLLQIVQIPQQSQGNGRKK